MVSSPVPLTLSWNPFANRATLNNVLSDGLNLNGIAATELKFDRSRNAVSLSTDGTIYEKAVVSEVTTIHISSSSAYKIDTESAADAARAKAAGTAIASAPGADGDVNVVSAASNAPGQPTNNSGSISVDTTVMYSDGSTEHSNAYLSADMKTSGNGLAIKRLDTLVDGATSESKILARLGLAPSANPALVAAQAPTKVGIAATVTSNLSASLTYVQQGDQKLVSGIETGSGRALISAFDPKSVSYNGAGSLSTTQESLDFTATIRGGALFSDATAGWLAGSMAETICTDTKIPGANGIEIKHESNASAEFATGANLAQLATQTSNADSISFTGIVNGGLTGTQSEQITLATGNSSTSFQFANGTESISRASKQLNDALVSVTWTPLSKQTGPLVISQATVGALDSYA